jgi:hypothetical protein
MKLKIPAAIVLALGLSLSGAAQAAGNHNSGGHGGSAAHLGGGHFGGHGGHFGGHRGGGRGYGYGALGFGLGLGLGALYYNDAYANDYADYGGYEYGPVPHDYNDNYPDDSAPRQSIDQQGAPPDVPGYWYRCADPAGYYPYVGICPTPWQAVPAVPPPPGAAH